MKSSENLQITTLDSFQESEDRNVTAQTLKCPFHPSNSIAVERSFNNKDLFKGPQFSCTELFLSDSPGTVRACRNAVVKLKLCDLDPDDVLTWFPPLFGLTKTSSGFMSGEEIGFITNGRPLLS